MPRLKVKEVGSIGLRSVIGVTPSYPSLSICPTALFGLFLSVLFYFYVPSFRHSECSAAPASLPFSFDLPPFPRLVFSPFPPLRWLLPSSPFRIHTIFTYISLHLLCEYVYVYVCVCRILPRSHHASSFDSGSMECYTILGSKGRTEPTGKRQGRIGEEDEGVREKDRKRENDGKEAERGKGDESTKERGDEGERDGGAVTSKTKWGGRWE